MGINTNLFDLTGQVALLTGASKGMGKSMAMALAEHGSKVVVSSRKLDQCEETAKEINDACGEDRAIAIACNAFHSGLQISAPELPPRAS